MSVRLELKKFQIMLLTLQAANMDPSSIHVPSHVRYSLGGFGPTAYIERERKRKKREQKLLERRVEYLKRQHYIERVKEGERRLYLLTAKGRYELLRVGFVLHMQAQRKHRWDGNFYLIIFDIKEEMKKYRDFIRKILKQNGCTMIQLSVWMTKYNPQPALGSLLRYLGLHTYFEIMKISCAQCSPQLRRKVRSARG